MYVCVSNRNIFHLIVVPSKWRLYVIWKKEVFFSSRRAREKEWGEWSELLTDIFLSLLKYIL